jgi:hypothetical protein
VPEFLEHPQFAQNDCVAEMDVRRGRVHPELDPEGAFLGQRPLEFPLQFIVTEDLDDPSTDRLDLFGDTRHG